MGQVAVITSGKGGVGKTTATANIGSALAELGASVVLIDADIGLRNLDVAMGLENRIVYDITDVVDGICSFKKALIKDKRFDNLFLLPAAQTKDKTSVNPQQMRDLCEKLKQEFDYILVDCPAGIEQGFKNAVAGADTAVIVTTPEVASVRDADRIIGLLDAEGIGDPSLVINRIRAKMVRRNEMLDIDDVIEHLAVNLLGIVPDDDAVVVSANRGVPVVNNEGSKAGQAFRNIARRLTGEHVPLMSLDVEDSFLSRLMNLFRTG